MAHNTQASIIQSPSSKHHWMMDYKNKLKRFKAKFKIPQVIAHNIEASRPYKFNFLNNHPPTKKKKKKPQKLHYSSYSTKGLTSPISQTFTPIYQHATQANFLNSHPSTKRPHKPNFPNNHLLHKKCMQHKPISKTITYITKGLISLIS